MGSLRSAKKKPTQKTLPESLISDLRGYLGKDGVRFFQNCKDVYGTVSPIYVGAGGIPHPVHFREGTQIRNFMRTSGYCMGWTDEDFDEMWVEAVEKALDIIID
jgi:hypothetical protein